MRVKATITYEYDMAPEHYPYQMQTSPSKMAAFDLDIDAMATFAHADNWAVSASEVFPGYTNAGYGCKRCGCRNAVVECDNLCVPCYRKVHPDTLTGEA